MNDESWQAEAEELGRLAPKHVLFLCVANSARRIHWGLPDPGGHGGSEEAQLQSFRDVRDELRRRLSVVFGR